METIIIPGTQSAIYPKLLSHTPNNYPEEQFAKSLSHVLEGFVPDFEKPVCDPAYDWVNDGFLFDPGKSPAVGFSHNRVKTMRIEGGFRLGIRNEYILFAASLIHNLITQYGWNSDDAWSGVCYDSTELGHYMNSKDSKNCTEPTGSRKFAGLFDLGNVFKLLDMDEENKCIWIGGGSWQYNGIFCPIANLIADSNTDARRTRCVGWFVRSCEQ